MKNLIASFSGGKTSAYMIKKLKDEYSHIYNIVVVMANTSFEHPKTLEFAEKCNREFDLNIILVEAVIHPGRKGTGHRVVTFEEAAKDGSIFETMIRKYGLPNNAYRHCNRELKLNPIHDYATKIFGGKIYKNYSTAIGIRVDEIDRIDAKAKDKNFIYPLVQKDFFPSYKEDVRRFWNQQSFNLDIPDHYGNCITCFKKSDRKLATISIEHPEYFDLFRKFENEYSHIKAPDSPRKIFRSHKTTSDIFAIAKDDDFKMYIDDHYIEYDNALDTEESCNHDCSST